MAARCRKLDDYTYNSVMTWRYIGLGKIKTIVLVEPKVSNSNWHCLKISTSKALTLASTSEYNDSPNAFHTNDVMILHLQHSKCLQEPHIPLYASCVPIPLTPKEHYVPPSLVSQDIPTKYRIENSCCCRRVTLEFDSPHYHRRLSVCLPASPPQTVDAAPTQPAMLNSVLLYHSTLTPCIHSMYRPQPASKAYMLATDFLHPRRTPPHSASCLLEKSGLSYSNKQTCAPKTSPRTVLAPWS